MYISQKISLVLVRISMGWLMFYAGITKLLDPQWSAAFYLKDAKTFPVFYQWFLQPDILPFTNMLNAWGLTLIGVSLLLGVGVRLSAFLGTFLIFLYYFPLLNFPYVGEHAYIVDEHIIYAVALVTLGAFRAGRVWGLENWYTRLPICARFPRLRNLLG